MHWTKLSFKWLEPSQRNECVATFPLIKFSPKGKVILNSRELKLFPQGTCLIVYLRIKEFSGRVNFLYLFNFMMNNFMYCF